MTDVSDADLAEAYVAMLGHDVEDLVGRACDPAQRPHLVAQAGNIVYAATKLQALAVELIEATKPRSA